MRSSGSASTSARAIPCLTAPAWPLGPPPWTRTRTSKVPSTPATFSGASASSRCAARGKYSSIVRPLNQVVPSPGFRITRATDVLRLPVPRYCANSLIGRPRSWLELQLGRRLCLVRVLGAGVDLQLVDLGAREAVPREHALDRLAQHLGRPALELVAERPAAQAARVARVTVGHLVVELVAGDGDLLGVDDHHEDARVDVRGVLGLVLAAERVGDLRSETPERLPFGVDEVPAALDLARFCVPGLLHKKRRTTVRRGGIVAARLGIPPRRRGSGDARTERRARPPRSGRLRPHGGPG